MIPILYDKTEISFTSNGLGRLYDTISCVVTEERNGIYECDFEYPVTGINFSEIQLGRIIAVEHEYGNDIQPFDIVSYTKPINGVVKFHAEHISYRLTKMVVAGTNITTLNAALQLLTTATPSSLFTYTTNQTGSTGYMAAADGVPRSVRQILGGVEGSILDTYGGEYLFDKFSVQLLSARGQIRPLAIRYGVNMLDYNEDMDYSGSYTSCVPYWAGSDGTVVKGNRVDSGQISYNDRNDCVPLDLTDKFETAPTAAQLESMAASIMGSRQTSLPRRTIDVDFVRLKDTNEYSQYSALLTCKLCDSVRVIFPRYQVEGVFKIVKTVYNVLLEKYDSIELGTLSTSLASALGVQDGGTLSGGGSGGIISINGVDLIGNKTSQEIKVVDMSAPALNMDGYDTPGNIDKEIYDDLTTLTWSSVITEGVLKLKELLAKILGWAGFRLDWSEYETNNTTNTWVPVFVGNKLQHRVIPINLVDKTMIARGALSVGEVSANNYKDVAVSYGKTFPAAPTVVVCLSSTSTAGAIGSITACPINETTTGFTLRVFNAGTAARSPAVRWIATNA